VDARTNSATFAEVLAIPYVSEYDEHGVSTVWSRATERLYVNPAEYYRDVQLRNQAVHAEFFQYLPVANPTETQAAWLRTPYTPTFFFLPQRWIDHFRFTYQDAAFWPHLVAEQRDRPNAFLGDADPFHRYSGPPVELSGYGPVVAQNTVVVRAQSPNPGHPDLYIFVYRSRSGRRLVRILFDLRTILLPNFG